MRRLILGTALSAVLVFGAASWAWTQGSQLQEPETLVFTLGPPTFKEVDLGRKGPSRADRLYMTGTALDDQGEVAAKIKAICEQINKKGTIIYCWNELDITGRGEIQGNGFQDLRTPVVLDPVAGGTGEFRNTRGQITVDFAAGTMTIELLP